MAVIWLRCASYNCAVENGTETNWIILSYHLLLYAGTCLGVVIKLSTMVNEILIFIFIAVMVVICVAGCRSSLSR